MVIKDGDTVTVDYKGWFEDGTVFDSSEKTNKPLTFKVGAKQVIQGFNDAVVGMDVGKEKTIKLQPKEAYGNKNPELIQKLPIGSFKTAGIENLKEGMVLLMTLETGNQVPVTIGKIEDNMVEVDLNHPMADKVLNFTIKVVKVDN